MLIVKKFDMRL